MKTAVVTDSNSGIFGEEARQLGIHVIPMPVIVDDHTFFENEDIDHARFFEAQLADRAVSSSQPSPASLMDVWELVLDSADELIYIPMSSGLSGSYQTAVMLAEDYDGRVEVADCHRVSVTQRQAVMLACRLSQEGQSAAQIRERIEADALKSCIYLTVESLEYFKRSGRVTAATAMLAGILNIKPVLVCRGENFDTHAKIRGLDKARSSLIEAVKAERESRFADYSDSQLIIGCAGSFLKESDEQEWHDRVRQAFPGIESFYNPLSLSVCCHTGPNAAGIGIALHPNL